MFVTSLDLVGASRDLDLVARSAADRLGGSAAAFAVDELVVDVDAGADTVAA